MKASEFVKEELNKFFSYFDNSRIRYEYDEDIETHLIEITPQELHFNEQFAEKFIRFQNDFEEMFNETIVLLDEDSINKIENPCLILSPNDFKMRFSPDDIWMDKYIKLSFPDFALLQAGENNYALAA
jgi:hypothetical protein